MGSADSANFRGFFGIFLAEIAKFAKIAKKELRIMNCALLIVHYFRVRRAWRQGRRRAGKRGCKTFAGFSAGEDERGILRR